MNFALSLVVILSLSSSPREEAELALRRGDFARACAVLDGTSRDAQSAVALAQCSFALGDLRRSRHAFVAALVADPRLTLDEAKLGPELYALFSEARSSVRPPRTFPARETVLLTSGALVGAASAVAFWQSELRFASLADDGTLSLLQRRNIETNAWLLRVAGITGAALAVAAVATGVVGLVLTPRDARVTVTVSPLGANVAIRLP